MKFHHKIAVVTGAASGIGQALSLELARAGATVVIADRNQEGGREVAETIVRKGGQAIPVQIDVTDREQMTDLVRDVSTAHGRLDFMFNNAGIALAGEFRDMSIEQWEKVFRVNLNGVLYGTKAAYDVMAARGFGHIVNTASIAGLVPVTLENPYTASKHAVVGMSTSLRAEGRRFGVRVSVVCPGVVDTPIWRISDVVRARRRDIDKIVDTMPFFKMKPKDAARQILKGIRANRAVIVLPAHARLMWWLHRTWPFGTEITNALVLRRFRMIRTKA